MLACSPIARAQGGYPGGPTGTGHYDVTYTVTQVSGNTAPYVIHPVPASNVTATDNKSCFTHYGGTPESYHIAAANTLNTTFTWNTEGNPANLAPICALITQNSSVNWSAQNVYIIPTGDCATGLPNGVYTSGSLSKSGSSTYSSLKLAAAG